MSRTPDVRAIREAVADVPDPELPPVTVGMLGMIHDVQVADGGRVQVELLPTYSGCPAIAMIERDVVAAVEVLPGVTHVDVRFRFDPPWSPDRIDAMGRERLREFGVAPPGGPLSDAVDPGARRTLPIAPPSSEGPRPCPYCGSSATTRDSLYGPTPCRDLRFCTACQQPFEAFRSA